MCDDIFLVQITFTFGFNISSGVLALLSWESLSWRLPNKVGRYMLNLDSEILVESWKKPSSPGFLFWFWQESFKFEPYSMKRQFLSFCFFLISFGLFLGDISSVIRSCSIVFFSSDLNFESFINPPPSFYHYNQALRSHSLVLLGYFVFASKKATSSLGLLISRQFYIIIFCFPFFLDQRV